MATLDATPRIERFEATKRDDIAPDTIVVRFWAIGKVAGVEHLVWWDMTVLDADYTNSADWFSDVSGAMEGAFTAAGLDYPP